MQNEMPAFIEQVNTTRYHGQPEGHYESFFLRANHPTRPLAFWIRYTIFSPKDLPGNALGELWAVFFNGEKDQHVAVKQEYRFDECLFDTQAFDVHVGRAALGAHALEGAIENKGQTIAWKLSY